LQQAIDAAPEHFLQWGATSKQENLMSQSADLTINIDGAARGNPGPAAFAYVIARDGRPLIEDAECLGSATNNVAEYTALVRALERSAELGGQRLLIRSDSELLVKQMNGLYRVKNEQLKVLYDQAKALCRRFASVQIHHVLRGQNSHADRLCNEVLDGARGSARPSPAKQEKAMEELAEAQGAAWEKLVTCLREVAITWTGGRPPEKPTPEAVARQLWAVLEEHGLFRH
jgi:ribonuclease HI